MPAGGEGRTGAGPWGFRRFLEERYKPTNMNEDRKKEARGPPGFLRWVPKPLDGPTKAGHGALRASEGMWVVVAN